MLNYLMPVFVVPLDFFPKFTPHHLVELQETSSYLSTQICLSSLIFFYCAENVKFYILTLMLKKYYLKQ